MDDFDVTCTFETANNVGIPCHRLPISWTEGKFQTPLNMGVAEFTVHCRLHWEKESITEMWRPEMY